LPPGIYLILGLISEGPGVDEGGAGVAELRRGRKRRVSTEKCIMVVRTKLVDEHAVD
jgi:hypothetical protein